VNKKNWDAWLSSLKAGSIVRYYASPIAKKHTLKRVTRTEIVNGNSMVYLHDGTQFGARNGSFPLRTNKILPIAKEDVELREYINLIQCRK